MILIDICVFHRLILEHNDRLIETVTACELRLGLRFWEGTMLATSARLISHRGITVHGSVPPWIKECFQTDNELIKGKNRLWLSWWIMRGDEHESPRRSAREHTIPIYFQDRSLDLALFEWKLIFPTEILQESWYQHPSETAYSPFAQSVLHQKRFRFISELTVLQSLDGTK